MNKLLFNKKMWALLPSFVLFTIVWVLAQGSLKDEDGFVEIFDGKTLTGWEGDPAYWRAENGSLVGEVTPDKLLKNNTFIIWRGGQAKDFELKGEFRLTESGNSGINYRSEEVDGIPYALRGYQADIDGRNRYTGQNYEERGRTTLAYRGQKVLVNSPAGEAKAVRDNVKNNAWTATTVTESLGASDSLQALIKSEDWNDVHLIVNGNRLQHYVNGILMSDVTDNDTVNRKLAGVLGIQVHVGPPMKVEYRNLRMKQL
ncbi:DUF1080 domain-containing protein [Pontibacter diazotrophicus]|uniref:DUF1080 domain-containing protein n=1 Tax=Pontibacter diazotrophicus TaxID=1400979 RepID=A0A3D8L7Z3_9BACT|nr:DUF1080 domain-containing protein [Pontibacter diazotrophicus]RDV13494.1 DUF1080 domain-containing protein [Pontibacter diazotrophicus]